MLPVLDSSSKKPYGIMDGTLTYIGDYDQCLDVQIKGEHGNAAGRYCAVNLMPQDYHHLKMPPNTLHLTSIPLASTGFYFGMCFPTNCSKQDVAVIVKRALMQGQHPFELETLSCDTREDTSYAHRFANMTKEQELALYFVLAMSALVATASLIRNKFKHADSAFVRVFAAQDNFISTCFYASGEKRSDHIDAFKLFILLFAIAGHAAYCLDTPFSVYLIGHYRWLIDQVSEQRCLPLLICRPRTRFA